MESLPAVEPPLTYITLLQGWSWCKVKTRETPCTPRKNQFRIFVQKRLSKETALKLTSKDCCATTWEGVDTVSISVVH